MSKVSPYQRGHSQAFLAKKALGYVAKKIIKEAMSPRERKREAKQHRAEKPQSNTELTQKVRSLTKGFRSLKCDQEQSLGRMTYRKETAYVLNCNTNQQNAVSVGINSQTELKNVLNNLLYYDPSNPATLITADYDTGTYSRDVCIKSTYAKCLARNNYQTSAEVEILVCQAKQDSNDSPLTAWSNGIADNPGTSVTQHVQMNQYPTDYDTFNKFFKIVKRVKRVLAPGQELSCTHSLKNTDYDPAVADLNANAYQPAYKSFGFMVIIKGVLSHDRITTTEQGKTDCGVDIVMNRTYVTRYDAGVNINYIVLSNPALQAFTNGAVSSERPITDNQSYSLA